MWPYHGLIALDLANERAREAREQAERWRLAHANDMERGVVPPHRNRMRGLVAWPVRAFSDVTHGLSDVACRAATRIEGRTA